MAAIVAAAASPLTWLVAPMSSLTAVRDPLVPTGMPWRDARGDLGDAEREQLLVGVDDLVVAGGEGARGEDGVGERDEEDGQGREDEASRGLPRDRSGTSSEGSPLGTGPVTDTPWAARSSAHDAAMPSDHEEERARDPLADPARHDQERQGQGTDDDRGAVGVAEVADDVEGLADGAFLVAGDADQLAELAEDQHDGDSGDVADQHRLREVVGDPAEAGEAGHEEDDPHHDREHRRERGVLRRSQLAASGAIAVATSSATVPSGPTTTRGADPRNAYARTGSSSAYSPALTGTPASWA